MASSVDPSEEDTITDMVEEIELYKYLYNDIMLSRGQCAEADEYQKTINEMEAKVAALLGDSAPTPQAAPAAPTPQVPSPIPPVLAPTPATPRMPSTHFTGIPGVSFASPHWPSAAPSPFAAESRRPPTLSASPSDPPDNSRKRPRPLSGFSPTTQGSSKRNAPSQPGPSKTKLEIIEEKKQAQLDSNDRLFAGWRKMAGNDEEQLKSLQEEYDESVQLIETEYQFKRDEELARVLQADEDKNGLSVNNAPKQNTSQLPDRPHPVKAGPPGLYIPPVYGQYGQGKPFDSDDDLEEIDANSFNSRFGQQSARQPGSGYSNMPFISSKLPTHMPYQTQYSHPHLHPSHPSYQSYSSQMSNSSPVAGPRPLPWMNKPSYPTMPGAYDRFDRAFDLVRAQEEIWDDDADIAAYNEKEFPEDIKNLLDGINDIREATKADSAEIPSALKVTLMKHQQIGLRWMKAKEESSHKGGILADDMGLGKTVQAIALMVSRPFEDEERRPTLIVAPKALMDQWRLEIQRHVKPGRHQMSVLIYHSLRRPWKELKKFDVVITTFGTLTANYKTLLEAENMQEQGRGSTALINEMKARAGPLSPAAKWHRVIIDEAQNIKNPSAKSAIACCRLNATYRWCLTGTPMMNRLEDFQSLLGFLRIRPYSNAAKFKADFVRRIKSGWGGEDVMKQLRVLVKSVCLRRTKTSTIDGQPILQLPNKIINKVHVVFDERESQVYEELNANTQRQINRYLDAGTLGQHYSHVLVLLLRLRQACCHPLLMQGFRNQAPQTSIPGVDKIANAKLLSPSVVLRIKANDDEEDGTCPVCMDSVENATIYIPCGHHVCSECWIRISDSAHGGAVVIDDDGPTVIRCQNCRGPVDPAKLTDTNAFNKVHGDPAQDSATETGETHDDEDDESTVSSEDGDSDSSTDDGEGGRKKKSLAELRADSLKNKAEKKRYLRRLEKSWFPSAKITKALEILQENEDRGLEEKTIIFSQFTSLLDLLEVPLARRGWNHVRFDGSMSLKERNAAVTAFTNDSECKIMLVSLKAGNSGLNLVAASHVIMFDPFWNPYIEDQAVDRAHRIGQVREVSVHRLLIEGTVEDRIVTLQDQKRELISGALDEGGTMNVSRLDARELAYLFGVRGL